MPKHTSDFGEGWSIVTDSQDVQFFVEYCGIPKEWHHDITAAMVCFAYSRHEDSVWFSESSAPWNLGALWDSVEYYREGYNV